MTKTIKYTGIIDRWPELAVTGGQAMWRLSQQEQRSDTEAEMLLLTGQFLLLQETPQYPMHVSVGVNRVATLPEGQILSVSGAPGTAGVAYLLDPLLGGTNSLQSWTIGAGALAPIGGYAGEQRFLVTCSAGAVTATIASAALSGVQFARTASGAAIGLRTSSGQRVDVSARAFPRVIGNGQPVGGLRWANTAGKMVCEFSEANTPWSLTAGAPTVERDYTGYDASGNTTGIRSRTGVPKMLKVTSAGGTEVFQIPLGAVNIALNGRVGMWVYVENQTGYGPGETFSFTGSIGIQLSTSDVRMGNQCANLAWNTNIVKEGWNFLKFVCATPNFGAVDRGAFTTIDGAHPVGTLSSAINAGTDSNFVANNVRSISVTIQNLPGQTIYFDSIWTGFSGKTCFVPMVDQITSDTINTVLPMVRERGWAITAMTPRNVWVSGQTIGGPTYGDFSAVNSGQAQLLCDAGWDLINHTVTHRPMGALTNAAEIRSEIEMARAWSYANGFSAGQEFYASPQSSSSRIADKVVAACGIVLQRHGRGLGIQLTPWGIPNPNHIGSLDLGHAVTAQDSRKVKACIDTLCRYGDSFVPFLHTCRTLGDDGSGTGIYTPDNLNIYASNLRAIFDHMAAKVAAGEAHGVMTVSEFFYGA